MKVPKCAFNFIMHSYSVIFFPVCVCIMLQLLIALCIWQIGISTVSNSKCPVKAGLCQVIAERERNKSRKKFQGPGGLRFDSQLGPGIFSGTCFSLSRQ